MKPITSFRDFWPYYLGEHAQAATRRIHVAGTILATVSLVTAVVTGAAGLAILALALGYGPAWLAHALIERNRPATFRFPLWSFAADLKMTALFLSGGLEKDLVRHGISPRR